MVTAASVQAAAEALALVQATGLPSEKFLSAMQQNGSFSKTLAMKLPKMIDRNFERHFSVQHMLKDMQIASRLGLSNHLELGVTAAARDRLLEQMQRGHGDEDYSAVARKYAQDTRPGTEAELELFQRRTAARAPEVPAEQKSDREIKPNNAVQDEPQLEPALTEPAAVPSASLAAAEMATSSQPAAEEAAALAPGTALQALQTHVPAAPFLNPVRASEAAGEQEVSNIGVETSHFLSQPAEPLAENEGPDARGFFSRLLRRANT
jgi:hypothetical protein